MDSGLENYTTLNRIANDVGRSFVDLSNINGHYFRVLIQATLSDPDYGLMLRKFNTYDDCVPQEAEYNRISNTVLSNGSLAISTFNTIFSKWLNRAARSDENLRLHVDRVQWNILGHTGHHSHHSTTWWCPG